jgi:hypothetical protein
MRKPSPPMAGPTPESRGDHTSPTMAGARVITKSDVSKEIACVIWHQQGHNIEVIYVAAESEHLFGSLEVAALLARDAGLESVSAPVGTRRWVRDPHS